MPTKRLIILANSVKKGQHCIAGREVLRGPKGYSYGPWIRPVSRQSEGELTETDCAFEDGNQPEVFDVVDIPLEECEGSAAQPENWFIDPSQHWVKVGDHTAQRMPAINSESPPDLWLAPSGRADRITPEDLAALGRNQSLYLIAVPDFRMELEWYDWQGSGYHRRRAQFTYQGRHYDLSLTDPAMEPLLNPSPPRGQSKTYQHPTGPNKILCVSLSPPYIHDQKHHKIVATVLEMAT